MPESNVLKLVPREAIVMPCCAKACSLEVIGGTIKDTILIEACIPSACLVKLMTLIAALA